jgi:hypothetical protein
MFAYVRAGSLKFSVDAAQSCDFTGSFAGLMVAARFSGCLARQAIRQIFTAGKSIENATSPIASSLQRRETRVQHGFCFAWPLQVCTKSGHLPVDAPHLIENK